MVMDFQAEQHILHRGVMPALTIAKSRICGQTTVAMFFTRTMLNDHVILTQLAQAIGQACPLGDGNTSQVIHVSPEQGIVYPKVGMTKFPSVTEVLHRSSFFCGAVISLDSV